MAAAVFSNWRWLAVDGRESFRLPAVDGREPSGIVVPISGAIMSMNPQKCSVRRFKFHARRKIYKVPTQSLTKSDNRNKRSTNPPFRCADRHTQAFPPNVSQFSPSHEPLTDFAHPAKQLSSDAQRSDRWSSVVISGHHTHSPARWLSSAPPTAQIRPFQLANLAALFASALSARIEVRTFGQAHYAAIEPIG